MAVKDRIRARKDAMEKKKAMTYVEVLACSALRAVRRLDAANATCFL